MSSTVNVFVLSPDTRSERRLDLHLTVEQLKAKLELITGIPVSNQAISLLESESNPQLVATLDDEKKALGFYGLRDWHLLKVDDTNPSASFTGQLTDVSQVEKFELSEAEYAQRQGQTLSASDSVPSNLDADSVLACKQRNKVGRFAPRDEPQPSRAAPHVDIPVGSRCQVESSEDDLHKRGTVRFVGHTKFGKGGGVWVGVEYDEPMGKNDGAVQGERYFSCRANYGVFVRPDKVQVGHFPVEEIDLDEEM